MLINVEGDWEKFLEDVAVFVIDWGDRHVLDNSCVRRLEVVVVCCLLSAFENVWRIIAEGFGQGTLNLLQLLI